MLQESRPAAMPKTICWPNKTKHHINQKSSINLSLRVLQSKIPQNIHLLVIIQRQRGKIGSLPGMSHDSVTHFREFGRAVFSKFKRKSASLSSTHMVSTYPDISIAYGCCRCDEIIQPCVALLTHKLE